MGLLKDCAATMILLLAVPCFAVHAQNLVSNPDFDTDIKGWTAQGSAAFNWDGSDGSPSAGSAHFSGSGSAGITGTATSDCFAIPMPAPATVDLRANVKFAASGNAGPSFYALAFTDGNCTAGGSMIGVSNAFGPPDGNGWRQGQASALLPIGTNGVEMQLFGQADGSGNLDMHFDHVQFGASGTVPVILQTFGVY